MSWSVTDNFLFKEWGMYLCMHFEFVGTPTYLQRIASHGAHYISPVQRIDWFPHFLKSKSNLKHPYCKEQVFHFKNMSLKSRSKKQGWLQSWKAIFHTWCQKLFFCTTSQHAPLTILAHLDSLGFSSLLLYTVATFPIDWLSSSSELLNLSARPIAAAAAAAAGQVRLAQHIGHDKLMHPSLTHMHIHGHQVT